MRIGIVGTGRIGRILAEQLSPYNEVYLYDKNPEQLQQAFRALDLPRVTDMRAAAMLGNVVLAVPDSAVRPCIEEFNSIALPLTVFHIATNISQAEVESYASPSVRAISVKIIGHAGEMALGQKPVIMVNETPADLAPVAAGLFKVVGEVVIGQADQVRVINRLATEKAVEAAVSIEEALKKQGFTDPRIIRSALSLVAGGVIKAYAADDLGPFAKELANSYRNTLK